MLKTTSLEEREKFLLNFTRALIRNTSSAEMYKLEEILQRENGYHPTYKKQKPLPKIIDIKKEVRLILSKKPKKLEPKKIIEEIFLEKSILPPPRERYFKPSFQEIPQVPKIPKRRLQIKDHPLPPRLQHISPLAIEKQIDLKKLNSLIQDPNVKNIECSGEGEKIIVSGRMGKKPTGIVLSKEEINEIIDIFSFSAKIPKNEGLFKAAYGKLIFTAMISGTISPTFLIQKIDNAPPKPIGMPPPRR